MTRFHAQCAGEGWFVADSERGGLNVTGDLVRLAGYRSGPTLTDRQHAEDLAQLGNISRRYIETELDRLGVVPVWKHPVSEDEAIPDWIVLIPWKPTYPGEEPPF
jgi:hypothetical protein